MRNHSRIPLKENDGNGQKYDERALCDDIEQVGENSEVQEHDDLKYNRKNKLKIKSNQRLVPLSFVLFDDMALFQSGSKTR